MFLKNICETVLTIFSVKRALSYFVLFWLAFGKENYNDQMSCREPKGRNRKNPRIFRRTTLLVDELDENESSCRKSTEKNF
jgi:hypothetical protein